jgi:Mn-dependent DtxR family transcriptional regulator
MKWKVRRQQYLDKIKQMGNPDYNALSHAMGVSTQATSRMVARLIREGHVKRIPYSAVRLVIVEKAPAS